MKNSKKNFPQSYKVQLNFDKIINVMNKYKNKYKNMNINKYKIMYIFII